MPRIDVSTEDLVQFDRITLREIRLPLRVPFRTARGTQADRRILLLEAVDRDGVVAWSECVAQETPSYLPETIDTAWHALEYWLVPRVVGESFAAPRDVAGRLNEEVRGHHMAKAAIEMAAWTLVALRRDRPLAALLGGTREWVEAGVVIGLEQQPEELGEKVEWARNEGYRRVKMKVRPGQDVQFVRAAREAVGRSFALAVDANGSYETDVALSLRELDTYGLTMIEQPLAWDDLVQHARLQAELETPICLDESITGIGRAREALDIGSAAVINIKPGRVGGFTEAAAIHDLCVERGVPAWCGGMLETGIGRAYNVALAALPGFTLPGDLSPSRRYWEQDLVEPEWEMTQDGLVQVPMHRPGLGVEVNRARIEALTVREKVLRQAALPRSN